MNKCVFTIVAKNYIGLARILGQSIMRNDHDIDFFIMIADEKDEQLSYPENVIWGRESLSLTDKEWTIMSFIYNLTEFCTAIKPFSFKYFFDLGYSKVVYFDPDIYTFSSLKDIFERLDQQSIMLVPHVADVHLEYSGEQPEWGIMSNGIFNLGFCGMKNSIISNLIVDWWSDRLKDKCFSDRSRGLFTDQKWMDWIPGFVSNENLYISQNLGYNLAPWNYFEREVVIIDDHFYVKHREEHNRPADKLVFAHFAGYDYTALKNGQIKRKRIQDLKEYNDLALILSVYRDAISANKEIFDSFISCKYSYQCYTNGHEIDFFQRRLFHGYVQNIGVFSNPFDSQGEFYHLLKKKKLLSRGSVINTYNSRNLPNINRIQSGIAKLFKILLLILGYERYALFSRALIEYHRPENHLFLLRND